MDREEFEKYIRRIENTNLSANATGMDPEEIKKFVSRVGNCTCKSADVTIIFKTLALTIIYFILLAIAIRMGAELV